MSSADMCQCAGCFPARQAAKASKEKMRLREKLEQIKKQAAGKSENHVVENKPNE